MKAEKKIKSDNLFPVVGIGASAGGLDAFKKLIKAIPENSGMAFVLVQHLDPKHESLLPELLQKVTPIPVLEISDDIKVLPNHIYVIPSNKMMVANDGILKLTDRPSKNINKMNLPIDLFFASLADVHQTHAIGVVLSGTASDGTLGLKAIKDQGGITFAQDKDSATFNSMPNSAIKAGVVDYILPPEEIPKKILEITQTLQVAQNTNQNEPDQEDEIIKKILSLLRIRKGTDFIYYKQTTIRRRIVRRMILTKHEELAAYLKYIKENNQETDILYNDLLIPVTSFFRDERVFSNLHEKILPFIIKDKMADEPIRVWIAGCSTGEEAYSIAICFLELLENSAKRVQIFATDLSEPAITKARIGAYSLTIEKTVSAERLSNFFTKTTSGYKINKEVRDMCIFAVHNLLKDPPFGKTDLICCRNVLIYMEPYLQKKALNTFHYSLNPKGFLLLGKSETTASVPGLFISTDKKNKLFSRKNVPGRYIQITDNQNDQVQNNDDTLPKNALPKSDYLKTADELILKKYAPASVIINEAMDIVHFRGNTSKYLEQLPGKPSHNLIKMAKHGLGFELRNLVHKAKKEIPDNKAEKKSIKKENISFKIGNILHSISIEVTPLPKTIEPYYLILFQDNYSIANSISSAKSRKNDKDILMQQLEKELVQIHEDIRSITEDQEAANEELQSDNEELLSSSEELQSLNEELETSKEELQSTNEELLVVNQEIINLNEQITEAKDYSEAIVATIHEPIIILDKNLRVKSANKSFYKNFRVTEAETIGELLYNLGNKQWNIKSLRKLLDDIILKNAYFYDYEISHNFPFIGEKTMLLNARRLIQESQGEQLILLAIHDTTEARTKALKLQETEKELLKKDINTNKIEKENLEKAVAERTKELIEVNKELINQYLDKDKKAEELFVINKELSAFTYIASHDLQEPLRKIQLFISRIMDDTEQKISEKSIDYFIRMKVSANRMQNLINDLLAYSKVNEMKNNPEPVDLNIVLTDVLSEFSLAQSIAETNTTVTSGMLPVIDGTAFQLEQLFTNLITNSIKYCAPDKSPFIEIESSVVTGASVPDKNTDNTKEYYKITVKDNGIGFEQQYAEKIFTLFQRLHDKYTYSGTGIGLTICKKIIENHHGFITANSSKDKGTIISVYIPV